MLELLQPALFEAVDGNMVRGKEYFTFLYEVFEVSNLGSRLRQLRRELLNPAQTPGVVHDMLKKRGFSTRRSEAMPSLHFTASRSFASLAESEDIEGTCKDRLSAGIVFARTSNLDWDSSLLIASLVVNDRPAPQDSSRRMGNFLLAYTTHSDRYGSSNYMLYKNLENPTYAFVAGGISRAPKELQMSITTSSSDAFPTLSSITPTVRRDSKQLKPTLQTAVPSLVSRFFLPAEDPKQPSFYSHFYRPLTFPG